MSDAFHGLEPGSHRTRAPAVEERAGPRRADVVPEGLEVLLEEVGPHGSQVVLQRLGELDLLALGQVLRALEQAVAGALEARSAAART